MGLPPLTSQSEDWYLPVSALEHTSTHVIELTKGMAAAQLRLLGIFAFKFVSDRVQKLQVTLMRPLLQGFNKRPTQGSTRLSVLERIRPREISLPIPSARNEENLRSLRVLGSGKHHHIGGRGLGHDGSLASGSAIRCLFEKSNRRRRDAGQIALSVRGERAE